MDLVSYMVQRGVANGKPGAKHDDGSSAGEGSYVYGPYAEPVLWVEPGDFIVAETADAFEGKIKRETDSPSALLNFPFLNPQCGPVAVEGAAKGDVLAIRIDSVIPAR